MSFADHLRTFRRLRSAHDALVSARRSVDNAFGIGREAIDSAIAQLRWEMTGTINAATSEDWCPPGYLTDPVALLDEALKVFGETVEVALLLAERVGGLFLPVIKPETAQ